MDPTTQSSGIQQQFDLNGQVAIVTGASKGIGLAIARGLAECGAQLVVSSRKQDAVDTVAEQFRLAGLKAAGIACHVGDPDQRKNLVELTLQKFGRIDILVNNAATNPVYGPIAEATPELFDKIMEVNVKAPMLLANLCYPHMKKQGGGSVIHVASVEGMKPSFGLGMYSVSKAALLMLAKNQAKEWGNEKVRVNALCPGLVQTKFSAAIWKNEAILKQVEQHLPLGRMAQPEEMVGLAVLLASGAGSYITGSVFTADGGHMLAG